MSKSETLIHIKLSLYSLTKGDYGPFKSPFSTSQPASQPLIHYFSACSSENLFIFSFVLLFGANFQVAFHFPLEFIPFVCLIQTLLFQLPLCPTAKLKKPSESKQKRFFFLTRDHGVVCLCVFSLLHCSISLKFIFNSSAKLLQVQWCTVHCAWSKDCSKFSNAIWLCVV